MSKKNDDFLLVSLLLSLEILNDLDLNDRGTPVFECLFVV